MESIAFDGMCRCCASEGVFKDLRSAYEWMGEVEVYADMIEECFNISMSMVENVNNGGICEVCITQLRNASNFKKQVQQTEGKFLKKIQDGQMTSNELKIEMTKDEPDDSYDATASDNEFFDPEYDIPIKNIKIEKEEAAKPKKRAAKASTSRAKKAKADDDAEPAAKRARPVGQVKLKTETVSKRVEKGARRVELIKIESEVPETDKDRKAPKISIQLVSSKKAGIGTLTQHRFNIKEILQWSNATPIRTHNGMGYACCFCFEQFPIPGDLKLHTKTKHKESYKINFKQDLSTFSAKIDITDLQCNICNENVESIDSLLEHLKKEHNRPVFIDLKNHLLPFKFNSDMLHCYICMKKFDKFKLLVSHMNAHVRNFVCEVCDAGFVNRRKHDNHIQTHKTGSFKCDLCPKVFNTLSKIKSHIKGVHKPPRRNRCGFCNETFKDYRQKEKHLFEVHQVHLNGLQCKACDRKFKTQRAFKTHTQRDHLMERQHQCSMCEGKFYSKSQLVQHMIKHTGVREFQCKICLKRYGRRQTLREHMRIHANDRRFKCEHCGQAFVQRCSWRGHMRNKHGEEI